MAPEPLRRRNHYVPAGYLKHFTPERTRKGRLWVYDREAPGEAKHLKLNSVGLMRDLYIRETDQGPGDEAERFLDREVEGPFVEVLDRLVRRLRVGLVPSVDALSPADRNVIARFVTFQMLRTPTERDATRWLGRLSTFGEIRSHLQPGSELRRDLESDLGRQLTPGEEDAFLTLIAGLPQFRGQAEDWIPRTFRNAARFAPSVASLEWRIVCAPASVNLVTCDMPIVCTRRLDSPGAYVLGGAFGEAEFEATLALTPRIFLLITHRVEDEAALRTEAFAWSVRERTIDYAHRWLFSKIEDPAAGAHLSASPPPSYYVEFAGRVFRVGHSPEEIEREIRRTGAGTLQFRYGVPPEEPRP